MVRVVATAAAPPPRYRSDRTYAASSWQGTKRYSARDDGRLYTISCGCHPRPPPWWCRPLGILGVVEEGPMGRLQLFVFLPLTLLAGSRDASSVASGKKGECHCHRCQGRGCVPHQGGRDRRGHRVIRVPRGPLPVPIPCRPRELLPHIRVPLYQCPPSTSTSPERYTSNRRGNS